MTICEASNETGFNAALKSAKQLGKALFVA